MNLKPPFGYYGSKHRISKKIIKLLPPHNAWVEAFCGSAAVTVAKNPSPIEIINDKDDNIVNFFEQLRNNHEALCRAVALTPYSRSEYYYSRKKLEIADPLERARKFLISTMMTINGANGGKSTGFSFSNSYSRSGKEARVNRWYNLPERLAKVAERLRNVRIENRDAREIIKMFINRPGSLIYLDPPYFMKRKQKYNIDANYKTFHEELLQLCIKSKSMLIISAYENPLYESYLATNKQWSKIIIQTSTRATDGIDYPRNEVLWINNAFQSSAKENKIPLKLTEKEVSNSKINPKR